MQNENNTNTGMQQMDGKSIAIISYLTIIGWIIAYVMYGNNKSQLAIYHLRQSLFIMLIGFTFYIVQTMLLFIPYLGWLVSLLLIPVGLVLFVLWIMGLISAINGEEKPIPIVGEKVQQLLSSIK
ncbi:DUF4870 domain-containing protein [Lutibacter sp.]|uniref:DUF4870 domain-containing protein n=1 Tax=Lutibacter sp. TaxID=1925666 RepID=UPI0027354F8D|nr:hypothetical protein [Lutibacter sp.]MDP3312745.1 hypothetical protein [Lutibacter sp.]